MTKKNKKSSAGRKVLGTGKMVVGAIRIASAASGWMAISASGPFLGNMLRRGMVQKGAEGGWKQIQDGFKDWQGED